MAICSKHKRKEITIGQYEKSYDMQYYVYFLTNVTHDVLYVGVTNNLQRRLYEHQNNLVDSFTKRYHVHKLIYFETTTDVKAAIEREKQIKSWSRKKKEALIATKNPQWLDLTKDW